MLRLDITRTRRRFEHLFRDYGLLDRIRSDSGHPFDRMGNLSQLSVWWIQRGITPELDRARQTAAEWPS
jgi:putative transposase